MSTKYQCTEVSISEIMDKSTLICSFVLKLVKADTGEEVTCYLPFIKSRAGHATVKHNSKCAKLYRLTFGENPTKRYSQATSLANHFIGEFFFVDYEIDTTSKGETYRKAISISPIEPVVNDGWTVTGALLGKSRRRKQRVNLGKSIDSSLKNTGNVFETSLIEKDEEPHSYLESPAISTTYKSNNVSKQERLKAEVVDVIDRPEFVYKPSKTLTEDEADALSTPTPANDFISMERQAQTYFVQRDDYETHWEQVSKTERVFHYHQKPQEVDGDYLDRVLNESMADW